MNKEQKAAVVDELSKELSDSEAIFAVDYRGISVPQAAELRADLRDADARFRVVKNRLTLLAAEKAGTDGIKEHLEGPTALALVKGDPALAAKTIFKLGREWEVLEYKGGLMEGEALDADSFQQIAKLPGRDQMNAQVAGVVASPLTGLVRGLGSMVQGLALQLQAIADQGLVSGEEPPKEVDAPAGDAAEEAAADEGGGSEDASSDEAEDDSSDGEADAPRSESEGDPDPQDSPEEAPSEEEAPAGEDAGQEGDAPERTGEGDAEMGEAAEEAQEGADETPAETSEDSNADDKEESN